MLGAGVVGGVVSVFEAGPWGLSVMGGVTVGVSDIIEIVLSAGTSVVMVI